MARRYSFNKSIKFHKFYWDIFDEGVVIDANKEEIFLPERYVRLIPYQGNQRYSHFVDTYTDGKLQIQYSYMYENSFIELGAERFWMSVKAFLKDKKFDTEHFWLVSRMYPMKEFKKLIKPYIKYFERRKT